MKRMAAEEVVAEYEWLRQCGVSPALAAQQLDRKPVSLARLFWRQKRSDLAVEMQNDMKLVKSNDS